MSQKPEKTLSLSLDEEVRLKAAATAVIAVPEPTPSPYLAVFDGMATTLDVRVAGAERHFELYSEAEADDAVWSLIALLSEIAAD